MTNTNMAGLSYSAGHFCYTETSGGWSVVVNVLPYGVHATLSHPEVAKPVATAAVQSEECRAAAQALIDKLRSPSHPLPDIQTLCHAFGQALKRVWFAQDEYEAKLLAMLNYYEKSFELWAKCERDGWRDREEVQRLISLLEQTAQEDRAAEAQRNCDKRTLEDTQKQIELVGQMNSDRWGFP